jgi:hypothetical protein
MQEQCKQITSCTSQGYIDVYVLLVGIGSIVWVSGDRLAVEMCEAFLQFNISSLSPILVSLHPRLFVYMQFCVPHL